MRFDQCCVLKFKLIHDNITMLAIIKKEMITIYDESTTFHKFRLKLLIKDGENSNNEGFV